MTGFHRRDGPLDTYSTVSCGDFHPIPFLSSKADLRTLEPQEPKFFHYTELSVKCQRVSE